METGRQRVPMWEKEKSPSNNHMWRDSQQPELRRRWREVALLGHCLRMCTHPAMNPLDSSVIRVRESPFCLSEFELVSVIWNWKNVWLITKAKKSHLFVCTTFSSNTKYCWCDLYIGLSWPCFPNPFPTEPTYLLRQVEFYSENSKMSEYQNYSESLGHGQKTHFLIVIITPSHHSPTELLRHAFQSHIPLFSNQAKNIFTTLSM